MKKDMVSVIIPAYNAMLTIEKCIVSVLEQTYRPIEVIVVNDGSKDNTLDILLELSKNRSELKVINQENCGVSETRNRAIAESCGKYICFLDSDDTYAPDYIEKCMDKLSSYGSQLGITAFNTVKNNKNVALMDYISKDKEHITIDEYLNIMLNFHDQAYWGANWNKMYLASVIKENSIRFQKGITIGEDLYFNLQYLMYVNCVDVIHEPCQNYQIDTTGSLSKLKRNPIEYWNQYTALYDTYLNLCQTKNVPDIERLNNFVCRMMFDTAYMAVANSKMSFGSFKRLCEESFALFLENKNIKTERAAFIWRMHGKFIQQRQYLLAFVFIHAEKIRRTLRKRF